MEEIRVIQKITSLDTAKTKRAYRRGQITKLKSSIEELHTKHLRDVKFSELQLSDRIFTERLICMQLSNHITRHFFPQRPPNKN